MWCNDDALAASVAEGGARADDAVWRMPLHDAYNHMLDSKVADLVNCAPSPYAGAPHSTCSAVDKDIPRMHFDIMAYNIRNRPGARKQAMALRAVYDHLSGRTPSISRPAPSRRFLSPARAGGSTSARLYRERVIPSAPRAIACHRTLGPRSVAVERSA